MQKLIIAGACTALFGLAATEAATAAPTLRSQTLYLDTKSNAKRDATAKTRLRLANRIWYVETVKGTYTFDVNQASTRRSRSNFCGPFEARPQRASRGQRPAPVFMYAEFHFALPRDWFDRANDCARLPLHHGGFEMTAGTTFKHMDPIGGAPTAVARGHSYRYLLQGAGKVGRFRLRDTKPRDNNGVLTISLRRARASETPVPTPAPTPAPPAAATPPAG